MEIIVCALFSKLNPGSFSNYCLESTVVFNARQPTIVNVLDMLLAKLTFWT